MLIRKATARSRSSREPLVCLRRNIKYSDQEVSIVDCASFVVAKNRQIREVFGFDSDFTKMGFVIRP